MRGAAAVTHRRWKQVSPTRWETEVARRVLLAAARERPEQLCLAP